MQRPITVLVLTVLVAACSAPASPPQSGSPRSIVLPAPPARVAAAQAPASGPSLADWRGRLDRLLPAADITELAGMPQELAPDTTRPGQLRYQWDAGRTFEYAGTRVKRRSLVSLGPIRTGSNAEDFAALHFNPPDERHRTRLKDEVSRQAERRKLDEQSTALAHQLADTFARREPAERIEGVGDAAAWAADGGDPILYVLIGGSTVALVVNVSDDPAANRGTAVALARRVVERAAGSALR
jgi:hypothetical protein